MIDKVARLSPTAKPNCQKGPLDFDPPRLPADVPAGTKIRGPWAAAIFRPKAEIQHNDGSNFRTLRIHRANCHSAMLAVARKLFANAGVSFVRRPERAPQSWLESSRCRRLMKRPRLCCLQLFDRFVQAAPGIQVIILVGVDRQRQARHGGRGYFAFRH